MKTVALVAWLAALNLAAAVTPKAVWAQDCGEYCEPCGFFGYEGTSYQPDGAWDMNCDNWTTVCPFCLGGASDTDARPEAILNALTDSSAEPLDEVVARFADRLLIFPERGLVAVKGSTCGRDEVATVQFVSQAIAARLVALGVNRLDEYLTLQAST